MAKRKMKPERDVEKDYSAKEFVTKLRRLADCIEGGERFQIQVAGERISVPPIADINIEHEREVQRGWCVRMFQCYVKMDQGKLSEKSLFFINSGG